MRLIVSINESSMTVHRNYNRIYRLLQCPYSSFIQVGLQAGAESSSGNKSEIIESSKRSFIRCICQYEKILINHGKCQLHSQLHSNYIQKMAFPTLSRKIKCSSLHVGLLFFHPFMVDCLPWERWFPPLWSSKGKYKLIVSEINKILTISLFRL